MEFKKLEQVRAMLKERNRKAVLNKLNDKTDNQQIKWLKKADSTWADAPELTPNDLQKLIKRFEVFSVQAENNPAKLYEKLLNTMDETNEYNKTGINPYSKEAQFEDLVDDTTRVIYEDTSFLRLLIILDNKCPKLDTFTGGLTDWINNCSKSDWQNRIAALKALKELYPLRVNISKILQKERQTPINKSKHWMAPLVKKIVGVKIYDSKKANKEVLQILKDEYDNFINEFDFTKNKTPFVSGGTRTSSSIARAIMFIYSKKESDKIVEYITITKHYKEL